ncbi:MAG: hypothetical protein N2442_12625 [Spirochaetes bacterium]|nr:hypothetical protein [Spirochaetota bacterium]
MNPWIVVRFAVLLLGIATFSYPLPSYETPKQETKESPSPLTPIKLEGILRLVGNEPFTRLSLMDSQNRIYYLEADSRDRIRNYVGSPVRVEGLLVRKQLRLADNREVPEELSIVQYKWEPLPKKN